MIKANANNRSLGGKAYIGFNGLLTITFIVLKLCGILSWSWLWVLAPLWLGGSYGAFLLLLTMTIIWVTEVFD